MIQNSKKISFSVLLIKSSSFVLGDVTHQPRSLLSFVRHNFTKIFFSSTQIPVESNWIASIISATIHDPLCQRPLLQMIQWYTAWNRILFNSIKLLLYVNKTHSCAKMGIGKWNEIKQSSFFNFREGKIDAFVYDTESLLYFKRAFHLNDFDLVGKPFSHVSYGIAVSHNLKKEGKELRDCISGILSQETFVQENHLRTKLWTMEVPGRDMTGGMVSYRDTVYTFLSFSFLLFNDWSECR